jgi:hypothetical protein
VPSAFIGLAFIPVGGWIWRQIARERTEEDNREGVVDSRLHRPAMSKDGAE